MRESGADRLKLKQELDSAALSLEHVPLRSPEERAILDRIHEIRQQLDRLNDLSRQNPYTIDNPLQ
jgi:uncharacterized coiled-coil DUF342 family protein